MGVSLFFKGTRGNGLKVCKMGFRFDARKNWNRLSGEEASQEVFQKMYRCDA